MADSIFGYLSILESRTVGDTAGGLRPHDESFSPGMISSVASPAGVLSEFFLKGAKSAVAANSSRLAIPASETNCTLPDSEPIPECDLESRLLALVRNPGAKLFGVVEEYPVPTPWKAGRELAHRNARNSSDHPKSHSSLVGST